LSFVAFIVATLTKEALSGLWLLSIHTCQLF